MSHVYIPAGGLNPLAACAYDQLVNSGKSYMRVVIDKSITFSRAN
jgi:hypothetical protein